MATATVPRPAAPAPAPVPAVPAAPAAGLLIANPRISGLRTQMLSLIAGTIAFAVLVGLVAWQANHTTYAHYRTVVEDGAKSVDAALDARSLLLAHLSDTATFLADPNPTRRNGANATWLAYTEKSRVAWSNVTDQTYGEPSVYAAVNQAETDYNRQIGAMYAYYDAKQSDLAARAFIGPGGAREILNQRLLPALGGLESLKLEAMTADYRAAQSEIANWRWALIGVTALLALFLLAGLLAVRRMHYLLSWPLVAALVLSLGLTGLLQYQLAQASADTPVLVHQAYEPVAGIQDLVVALNQARALENVAVFDNANAPTHLADFDNYALLINQKLCGVISSPVCSAQTFLKAPGQVADDVISAGTAATGGAGVPPPLIANINFPQQPQLLEDLRLNYRGWISTHAQLADLLRAKNVDAARQLSNTTNSARYNTILDQATRFNSETRSQFDRIWQRVYNESTLGEFLALIFPAAGLLAAYGLARRRSELFI